MKKDKIVIITGTFDPLSADDLLYIKRCHHKGDWLVVGIHTDWWMQWTEGGFVQNYETRTNIIKAIKYVDEVFSFILNKSFIALKTLPHIDYGYSLTGIC